MTLKSISILLFVVLVFSSFSGSYTSKVHYHGHKLFRVTPVTKEQLQHVMKINQRYPGELDYWLRTTNVNLSSDILVSPNASSRLSNHLKTLEIPHKIIIHDVGKALEEDEGAFQRNLGFFHVYRSYDEVQRYLWGLAHSYPEFTQFISIGTSSEGRPLNLLRISSNPTEFQKPAIWINGGAHSREQIGTAVTTFIAMQLCNLYYKDATVQKLVDYFDWYIFPIMNPDGYVYAQNTDRLWRKTRSFYANPKDCVGVDANRNWDVKWNGGNGSSSDPCSEIYAGPYAFSEPETKATSTFMLRYLKGRLKLFIDLHSYSQRWLSAWGYTAEKPPNYQQQISLAKVATKALELYNGTKYTVGSTGNIMYTVTGGARDWVYDVMGADFSYVVELRDEGQYGFVLPVRFILPTSEETWLGIRAMALELFDRLYEIPHTPEDHQWDTDDCGDWDDCR